VSLIISSDKIRGRRRSVRNLIISSNKASDQKNEPSEDIIKISIKHSENLEEPSSSSDLLLCPSDNTDSWTFDEASLLFLRRDFLTT
jgi:hypothetical protein